MSGGLWIALAALIVTNAFFVGGEFAIISARRSTMEVRRDAGSRAARTVLWAMENVSLVLATAQVGVTACSVALGVVAEPALAELVHPTVVAMGLPDGAAHGVAVGLALLFITALHVIVGELVPKYAAVSSPERLALVLGPALVWVARSTRPVIAVLNGTANLVVRMLGVTPRDEITSAFTADEVHRIVERSRAEGTLDDAQGLLTGAIEFSDRTAGDVMVPLARVATIPAGATVAEVEARAAETGFSRFPVSGEARLSGYLHVKDVLYAGPSERDEPVHGWRIRQLPSVAADEEVEAVLRRMGESGAHIAAVSDGSGVVGVVFLEDILEELVGEVGTQTR